MATIQTSRPQFTIRYQHGAEYLHAWVTGPHDGLAVATEFWHELAAQCRQSRYTRLLVEKDLGAGLSQIEMFDLVQRILELDWGGPIKIGFVDLWLGNTEVNRFGELVAHNRGLVGNLFPNVDDARAWLLRA